eukprot:Gb_16591 [translate_table: standard]
MASNMCNGSKLDLPVIDLSLFPSKLEGSESHEYNQLGKEFRKVRKACEDLGFFRVINHGIDPTLIETMDSVTRQMFTLPTQVKERAISPVFFNGYVAAQVGPMGQNSMAESMFFPTALLRSSIQGISDKLWPQGNHEFCETVHSYNCKVSELSGRLIKILISSLGLDETKHYKSASFEKCHGWMRMNYYCSNNTCESMSSIAHTDVCCLTVLYQDDVGGLEIRTKDGNWISADPLPGSFVVNIGNSFKMWSNGIYRSAEHRVVYGGTKSQRLSLAFFLDFPSKAIISAPEDLIDDAHPRRYKVVTLEDLTTHYKQFGPSLEGIPADFLLHIN